MMELEKSIKDGDGDSQRRLYNLRPIQLILNMLLTRNIKELKPMFDLQYRCRYPEVEYVSQLEPVEVIGTLESMSMHSILDSHFHDRIPVCDKCASANLTIVYLCTYCKSRNIEKSQLVEHSSCGYIDSEERYIKGSETVCPRCNSYLRMNGTDVKIQGGWFSCKSCSRWHHEPTLILTCRECERMMSIRDVSFADLYSYTLHEDLDLHSIIFPENIRKSLEELGYQAESPGVLMGKTGIKHQFDIVCHDENATTAIDVVYSDTIVNESHIMKQFAHVFDCNVNQSIFIAIPGVTEAALKLAAQYGISIIQGNDARQVIDELKYVLQSTKRNEDKLAGSNFPKIGPKFSPV